MTGIGGVGSGINTGISVIGNIDKGFLAELEGSESIEKEDFMQQLFDPKETVKKSVEGKMQAMAVNTPNPFASEA